jgi:WD40 repeat protein
MVLVLVGYVSSSHGKSCRTIELRRDVTCLAASPSGETLAAYSGGNIILLQADDWETRTFKAYANSIWCLDFSPDGGTLASGSTDGIVRLWDVKTGKLLDKLVAHQGWVLSVAFSPDGKTLVSGGWIVHPKQKQEPKQGGEVFLWDLGTKSPRLCLRDFSQRVEGVVFWPDGTKFVTKEDRGVPEVWDATTGRKLRELDVDAFGGSLLEVSPRGNMLAVGDRDWKGKVRNTFALIDTTTYERKATVHDSGRVAFSPDEKVVAVVHRWPHSLKGMAQSAIHGQAELRLYDTRSGKRLARHSIRETAFGVVSIPSKNLLVTGGGKILRVFKWSDILPREEEKEKAEERE